MPRLLVLTLALILGHLVLITPTLATAVTAYADMAGSSFLFQNMEEDTLTAGDPAPIFGAPTVVGDALLFSPGSYISTATGAGGWDETKGVFVLDIISKDKDAIAVERLLLNEIGDYSLTGVGTATTEASAFASFSIVINEINLNGALVATAIATNVNDTIMFSTPTQAGGWSLTLDSDIQSLVDSMYVGDDVFATEVSIEWNNDLATHSEDGTTALIQKKLGLPAVTVTVIPEPSAGLLIGLGLIGLARKSRG